MGLAEGYRKWTENLSPRGKRVLALGTGGAVLVTALLLSGGKPEIQDKCTDTSGRVLKLLDEAKDHFVEAAECTHSNALGPYPGACLGAATQRPKECGKGAEKIIELTELAAKSGLAGACETISNEVMAQRIRDILKIAHDGKCLSDTPQMQAAIEKTFPAANLK